MSTSGSSTPGSESAGQSAAPPGAAKPARPRRRRWRWVVASAGLLLLVPVLLGVAAPWIAGVPAVRDYLLSFAGRGVNGRVAVGELGLSWFGPMSLRDVRLTDAGEHELFSAAAIQSSTGLWELWRSWPNFGELRLEAPRAAVQIDADGTVNWNRVLRPGATDRSPGAAPVQPAEPVQVPELRGRLVIADGVVTLARGDAPAVEVRDLQFDVTAATLDDLRATLSATLDDGARLAGDLALAGAAPRGAFDVQQGRGALNLALDRPTDVGRLLSAVLGRSDLSGAGQLKIQGEFAPGNLTLALDGEVRQLRSDALASAAPLDATLAGRGTLIDGQLAAHVQFAGTPGQADLRVQGPWPNAAPALDAAAWQAAVLEGRPLNLPGLTMSGSGDVDLAAIERAAPGLLKLDAERAVIAGRLKIEALELTGGADPRLATAIRLDDVQVQRGAAAAALRPLRLEARGGLIAGQGLQLDQLLVQSGSTQVSGSGTPRAVTLQFDADLAELRGEIQKLADFEPVAAGEVRGSLQLSRDSADAITTALAVESPEIRYEHEGRPVSLRQVKLAQRGSLTIAGGGVTRVAAESVELAVAGVLAAGGSGWLDVAGGGFEARLALQQSDLARLSEPLTALGIDVLRPYAGNVSGELTAGRAARGAALNTAGSLRGAGLAADGRPIGDGAAALTWQGVSVGADAVQAGELKLENSAARLNASGVDFDAQRKLIRSGKIDVAGDLGRVLAVAAAAGGRAQPADLAGQFEFRGDVTGGPDGTRLSGAGGIRNLEIGGSGQRIREDQVTLVLDASIDSAGKVLRLGENRIQSGLLNAEISGRLTELDGPLNAKLNGSYDVAWDRLTRLLHELVPATADLVVLHGVSRSDFELSGPLAAADGPPLAGAKGAINVLWEKAELAGVALGPADLRPRLSGGVLSLAVTLIEGAGGKVRLGGQLDFSGPAPLLRMPGERPLLDGVTITRQLSRELLSRINPMFYALADAQGRVRLVTRDISFPLGPAVRSASAGGGRLELDRMTARPGGLFGELLALGGVVSPDQNVEVVMRGCDFTIKDGRIYYDDFTMIFPEDFQLKFYGSVGLDDTLDLIVSVPVRPAMLKRLGLSGAGLDYARALKGLRIDIPLQGSRANPKLDFSRVDTQPLLAKLAEQAAGQVIEDAAGGALGGVLEGVLGGGKSDEPGGAKPVAEPPKPRRPADKPADKPAERPRAGEGKPGGREEPAKPRERRNPRPRRGEPDP